jgi:perosamine synthetase
MIVKPRAVPLLPPWYGVEECEAITAYVRSGGWGTEFRKTREFEQAIAEYVGSRYCLVTPSGTMALTLALIGLGIGSGDEVIVPDYTMIASATSVVLAGATPRLVDVDPATLCLDPGAARQALTSRTRALMLVSINGRAPAMESLESLAREQGLVLIEDACQAMGSRYGGKHLGTIGAVGCFSFSPHKLISTGNGGCVVTNDAALFEKMRRIKDFGRPEAGVDRHEVLGFNFKFTDFQAVIGLEQMKRLAWSLERKKSIYRRYREALRGVGTIELVETDLNEVAPWCFDVLVDRDERDRLVAALRARGIGARPFYPAIHTQPPFADVCGEFPVSEGSSRRGLWLPSSPRLVDDELDYVIQSLKDFYVGGSADSV